MAPHPQAPRHRVDGQLRDSSPPRAERRALLGTEGPDATGRKIYIWGPTRTRPPFPRRPLNPSSVDPADLSADQKAEVVGLVRLVQTDFDPEKDPNGWDSVAVLVRGVGYGDEEIRKMGYPQLLAIFRTSAAQMRLQKTGSLTCGVATATASIVTLEMPNTPKEQTRDKPCKVVLREWWDDPKKRQRILEAGSAEKIGLLVGFSETAVKEAKPIWGEIQKHLAFRRQELRGLQEMRRNEEERLGG